MRRVGGLLGQRLSISQNVRASRSAEIQRTMQLLAVGHRALACNSMRGHARRAAVEQLSRGLVTNSKLVSVDWTSETPKVEKPHEKEKSKEKQRIFQENVLAAAKEGDLEAQFILAKCFHEGTDGFPRDDNQALHWFLEVANHPSPSSSEEFAAKINAQLNLRACYLHSDAIGGDEAEAEHWQHEAVKSLAEFADTYMVPAAEKGDKDAQYQLGVHLSTDRGLGVDLVEAAKWFTKSAEQGHASAQVSLGWLYLKGEGVDASKEEALIWFSEAAAQGEPHAQSVLATHYYRGDGMVEQDQNKAFELWLAAAKKGDVQAMNMVAHCYYEGTGVSKDEAEAISWFRRTAKTGDESGKVSLGLCLLAGDEQAQAEAVKWLREAAEAGNAEAQIGLGQCYRHGKGVARDEAEADKWCDMAVAQDHATRDAEDTFREGK